MECNQLLSLLEFPAPHAELNSCWDFHWTPFRSVWLLSLPSMLFKLELTSAHLWALLLLIRTVLKVNTSIYKRKVPSVHHPKSKYTLQVFRANPSLATQTSKKYSAITQTSTIICCLNNKGAQAHIIIIWSWHCFFSHLFRALATGFSTCFAFENWWLGMFYHWGTHQT